MKTKIIQGLKIALFFAVGVAFIWVFVAQLSDKEIDEMFFSVRKANYFWAVVAFVISVLSCYVRALRWRQMLKPMGYGKVSIHKAFLAIMSGYLTNLAVPRLGEVMRCAMLRKSDGVPVEKSLGSVITERAIDLILFVFIFLIAVLMEFNVVNNYLKSSIDRSIFDKIKLLATVGVGICVIVIVLVLFVRRKFGNNKLYIRLRNLFAGFRQGILSILHLEKPLLFVFYSLTIWLLWIAGTYAIFRCFEASSVLGFDVSVVVTALSAIGPMITPGGIGLYPAIFAQTLLVYGVIRPIGYAAGWLSWLVSQLASVVFGLAGFVYFSQNQKK
ncbi:MAG: flippase-like domain-containing protein [Bacteroidales bacterium]|nr:flippase-like domain-containing protein [Bacteroidales bacterium]